MESINSIRIMVILFTSLAQRDGERERERENGKREKESGQ